MPPFAYVTRRLPDEILRFLESRLQIEVWDSATEAVPRDEFLKQAARADGLLTMVTDRVDAELFARAERLRVVSNLAVGYDNIDIESARRRGIRVTNTPDVLTETTADLTFALLLATARRLIEANRMLHEGRWQSWSLDFLAGTDVHGKTLGIVGLGRIGRAVARRASGFGMRLLYHNRRPSPEAEALGAVYRALDDLLREADFVVLLTPLTPETRGLIGRRELGLMKSEAILINTSRGPVVDETALVEALREGRIRAAGLDVFEREPLPPDHPLTRLPNAVLLPHIGSASTETRLAMARLAAENLVDALEGRTPRHVIV